MSIPPPHPLPPLQSREFHAIFSVLCQCQYLGRLRSKAQSRGREPLQLGLVLQSEAESLRGVQDIVRELGRQARELELDLVELLFRLQWRTPPQNEGKRGGEIVDRKAGSNMIGGAKEETH